MKKFISVLTALALSASLTTTAAMAAQVAPSDHTLTVDGREAECQSYNIDGYNYFRLRDLADILNGTANQFEVVWSAESNTVRIIPGVPYTTQVPSTFHEGGREQTIPGAAFGTAETDQSATAKESSQTIIIGEDPVEDLSVWNIGGSNYFRLADLQRYLGFNLDFDGNTNTVLLRTQATGLDKPELTWAKDYSEIYTRLSAGRNGTAGDRGGVFVEDAEDAAAPMEEPFAAPTPEQNSAFAGAADAEESGASVDYSGTNVQVAGIDEGDIVKTDGRYLYVLNGEWTLTIIEAAGTDTRVVSQTAVGMYDYTNEEDNQGKYFDATSVSKRPTEMYIEDGRLVVLSNYSYGHDYEDAEGWHWEYDQHSCVDIYDVSDPTAPTAVSELGQDGSVLRSRLVNGHVYVVSRYWVWDYDEDDPGSYVPVIYENGVSRAIAADCIAICPTGSQYLVVADYDVAAGVLNDVKSLLGSGDEIYMSGDHLYVLGSNWETEELATYPESIYTVTHYRNTANTEIYRFDVSAEGITLGASGKIPGSLESQFSADEYQGYLRLVTTREDSSYRIFVDETYDFRNYQWDESSSSSGLYILDETLDVVGSVTNLAPDEYIYSARFDGDIAYFCTYERVDPLFAVDVSDPAAPTVLSALKISGFSEYLHNWTDGRLFGFGQEADEETGRTQGLKLVMFDTTDKANVTVASTLNLDARYSAALYNHKAFFIVPEKNIIGFVADGDQYFIFSYDEEAGFQERTSFTFDTHEYNVRGLYIGDWAYIVGNAELMVLDMTTWAPPSPLNISVPEESEIESVAVVID